MISFEIYKVIHLASVFIFLTGSSVLLLNGKRSLFWMISTGLSSFLILVAGMGLVARLGNGFPGWVIGKLVVWLVLTGMGHMVAKRFPEKGHIAYVASMVLAILAAYLAVFKPA